MTSISIAIATYNRADELKLTLEGLRALNDGRHPAFELLVVDNNSSDATRAVVEGFEGCFSGRLRYILEENQGLSHARNRAIAESHYEVVAFLDDDVDVDPNWLVHLAQAFEPGEVAAVGGRAYLVFPCRKPGWLGENDEGYLTKVELGPDRRDAGSDQLFGVNLALRKDWVERVGGFRVDLGRVGTCLIGSEEGELLERIAEAGGRLVYEPSAIVGHRVARERLSRRWFWSRSYWGHRGEVRRVPADQASPYALLRATWHVVLAVSNVVASSLSDGIQGPGTFHQSVILSARLGTWTGLATALVIRRSGRTVRPQNRVSIRAGQMSTSGSSST